MNTTKVSRLLDQAECFNILAALFCEPESGVHDHMKLYDNLVKSIDLLKPKAIEMAKKLRKTAFEIKTSDLKDEYNRLFTSRTDTSAYPCSCHYINVEVEGKDLIEWLTDFYTMAGFSTVHFKKPPDHICTELKFIYHLHYSAAREFKKNNISRISHLSDLRCQFIHDHMIHWIPDFTHSILFNSKSPFYLQLSILTRTLLVNCNEENNLIPI